MGAKTKTTILFVEDDDSVRLAVTRQLMAAGFNTTSTRNGREAFAAGSDDTSFDVGVFDINLPDVGGAWLAERMRHLGRVGRVLFFTGTTHELSLRIARSHGRVISKSEGVEALIAAIQDDPTQAPKEDA